MSPYAIIPRLIHCPVGCASFVFDCRCLALFDRRTLKMHHNKENVLLLEKGWTTGAYGNNSQYRTVFLSLKICAFCTFQKDLIMQKGMNMISKYFIGRTTQRTNYLSVECL